MLVQADGVVRPRLTLPPLESPAGSLVELVGGLLPLDGRVDIESLAWAATATPASVGAKDATQKSTKSRCLTRLVPFGVHCVGG